ncbi:hypothetical protein [Corynebacterium glaucum]|uniref:hypothetical protein n=1 Tax=Corynebacterium glaucum TaxID=187491 RepID=UPI002659A7EF|nr:hypothetical protein [Corynebacterium glaucum]
MHQLHKVRCVAQRAILYSRTRMELMREFMDEHTIEGAPNDFNVDFETGEISFCDGRAPRKASVAT